MNGISFNTQPREGGCKAVVKVLLTTLMFQHTAARRRLHTIFLYDTFLINVSTHSRAKAAAKIANMLVYIYGVSTHSRAKAAAARTLLLPCCGK